MKKKPKPKREEKRPVAEVLATKTLFKSIMILLVTVIGVGLFLRFGVEEVIEDILFRETTTLELYSFNEKIIVGDFAYTFHNYTVASMVGEYINGELIGKQANGMFIIFDITIENIGTEPKILWDTSVTLMDIQQQKFRRDLIAESYSENIIISKQMEPGISKRGKIIFDVPTDFQGYIEIASEPDATVSGRLIYISLT